VLGLNRRRIRPYKSQFVRDKIYAGDMIYADCFGRRYPLILTTRSNLSLFHKDCLREPRSKTAAAAKFVKPLQLANFVGLSINKDPFSASFLLVRFYTFVKQVGLFSFSSV
jgi:hypothetical protein